MRKTVVAFISMLTILAMSIVPACAASDDFIIGGPYIKDVHQYLEQLQREESPVWSPPEADQDFTDDTKWVEAPGGDFTNPTDGDSNDRTEPTEDTEPIVKPEGPDRSEPSGDFVVPDSSDSGSSDKTATDTLPSNDTKLAVANTTSAGPSVDPYNTTHGTTSGRYVDVPHLTPGVATTYNDTAGHWAETEIAAATRNGLMNGMGDGSFAPDEKVTLGQAITVYLRTCRFSETKIDASYSEKFADVRGRDWLVAPIAIYAYLDPAYANKDRFDNYGQRIYDVDRPASREDVALMFGAGYRNWLDSNPGRPLSTSLNDISSLSKDAQNRIAYLNMRGVVKGYPDGGFHPAADVTRAEFSAIANRAFTAGISDYYVLPEVG